MKKNEWNFDLMDKQLKIAQERCNDDPLYKIDIDFIAALKAPDSDFFPRKRFFKDFIKDDIEWINKYPDFYNHFVNFANYRPMLPKEIEMAELNYRPGIPMGEVHDFYNHLGGEWQKRFNHVYKERHNNFRIHGLRSYNVFLPGNKYSYMNLGENVEISTFIDLAHEYAHAITDSMIFRDYEDDGNYPFIELAPQFFELAFGDWISNSFEGLDIPVAEERLLTIQNDAIYAEAIVNFTRYIVSIMEDGVNLPTTVAKAIDDISKRLEITKKEARRSIANSKKEELIYLIPYLTAIELYYIYSQDEKEALNILKKIVMMEPRERYEEYLRSLGININEHSDEYVQKVLKKYKEGENDPIVKSIR